MTEHIPGLGRGYSDREIDIIRKGVADGLSASEICKRLPISRSRAAVIGRAHRMGLSLTGKRGRHYSTTPKSAEPRRPRPPKVSPPAASATEAKVRKPKVWPVPETAVSLTSLATHICRWPVGLATGADQLFCGAKAPDGQVYCCTHEVEK